MVLRSRLDAELARTQTGGGSTAEQAGKRGEAGVQREVGSPSLAIHEGLSTPTRAGQAAAGEGNDGIHNARGGGSKKLDKRKQRASGAVFNSVETGEPIPSLPASPAQAPAAETGHEEAKESDKCEEVNKR
ncbi:hypothetical protein ColLi_12209 [Colletotrichum liriopes]|uniref:Uncharacterized protein n=1 Tax=Colletotrichum liriopes TaxID=708192 RepID=A0AA37GXZ0_9PEZI|nr:hypothetical protein ColLi_12209 [Colletotrichum liriopes]